MTRLYIARAAKTIAEIARRLHDEGATHAFVTDAFAEQAAVMLIPLWNAVPCAEQGAEAELERLKEFLGDALPPDWERRRFEGKIAHRPRGWSDEKLLG